MRASLLTPAVRFDRSAIMLDAHRQYRTMNRHGWDWRRSLRFAWSKAHERRARALRDQQWIVAAPIRHRGNPSCLDAAIAALAGKGRALEQRA